MTSDLVLHERTRQDIEAFLQQPTHSLLLVAANGSGKLTLAQALVGQLLNVPADKMQTYQYYKQVEPIKNTISIEAVRELQDFVRLKTAGTNPLRRAIIIENAQHLTTEAQNAFLKLLEEPPTDTVIILTAASGSALLPTISSRAPKITVKAPSQADTLAYFEQQGYDKATILKTYHLSRGRVGMMTRLLQNQDDELLQYINQAKQFLAMKPFDRLVFAEQFNKQKLELSDFLWALQRVSDAALYQSAQKNGASVNKWQKTLQQVIQAQDSLSANPQAKLLLTNLSLTL